MEFLGVVPYFMSACDGFSDGIPAKSAENAYRTEIKGCVLIIDGLENRFCIQHVIPGQVVCITKW